MRDKDPCRVMAEQVRQYVSDATGGQACAHGFEWDIVYEALRNHTALPDLIESCEVFVRKVECGEARSKRSYAQMKSALDKAYGKDK